VIKVRSDCCRCPFYRVCTDKVVEYEDVKEYLVKYCPLEKLVEHSIDEYAKYVREELKL